MHFPSLPSCLLTTLLENIIALDRHTTFPPGPRHQWQPLARALIIRCPMQSFAVECVGMTRQIPLVDSLPVVH